MVILFNLQNNPSSEVKKGEMNAKTVVVIKEHKKCIINSFTFALVTSKAKLAVRINRNDKY